MKQFVIERTSMYPILLEGDEVIIGKSNNFKVGDILVYNKNASLVSHRLIKVKPEYFILKGDNNIKSEWIEKKKVVGKVIFINKKKFNNNFLQRVIAFCSFLQSKISFLCYEKNAFLRKSFKVITNPFLYSSLRRC